MPTPMLKPNSSGGQTGNLSGAAIERPRQSVEGLRGERLGPTLRIQAAALDLLRADQPAQGIAQRLAPMSECGCDDRGVMRAHLERRLRSNREPRHRRPYLRWWLECSGANIEQSFDGHPRSEHDGEAPVVGITRLRGQARHDFPLQHDVEVCDRAAALEQVKQQRGGDVVGKVAHDAQPAAALARELREVELQCVYLVQHESRAGGELRAQQRGQVTIDLDRIERSARGAQQLVREGAAPRQNWGLIYQKEWHAI